MLALTVTRERKPPLASKVSHLGLGACLWADQGGTGDKEIPSRGVSSSINTQHAVILTPQEWGSLPRNIADGGESSTRAMRVDVSSYSWYASGWVDLSASLCLQAVAMAFTSFRSRNTWKWNHQFFNRRPLCRIRVEFSCQMGSVSWLFIFDPLFLCHWIANMLLANWKYP